MIWLRLPPVRLEPLQSAGSSQVDSCFPKSTRDAGFTQHAQHFAFVATRVSAGMRACRVSALQGADIDERGGDREDRPQAS
jgi:hypothetical protein